LTLPDDRRYSREHEWIRAADGEGVIGLTKFAVDELGDIVYVELPAVGATMTQFASFGVVESVKAVSDLYAPASGTVVAVNEGLRTKPELLNSEPHGDGWICRISLADAAELDALLDARGYAELIGSE
jgi:glycine cleavage system H protein